LLNPDDIEEFRAVGGYQALCKVLIDSNPAAVIESIQAARLLGRGGARRNCAAALRAAGHRTAGGRALASGVGRGGAANGNPAFRLRLVSAGGEVIQEV